MKELIAIFSNELFLLTHEYKRCPSPAIRKQIKVDIQLLKKAIELCAQQK